RLGTPLRVSLLAGLPVSPYGRLESDSGVSRGLALRNVPGLQGAVHAVPDGQCSHRVLGAQLQLAVPREVPLAPTALERLNLAVAEVHRRTSDHFGHRDHRLLARCFLLLRVLELLVERDEVTVRDSLRALLAALTAHPLSIVLGPLGVRSEERRVGKECRSGWSRCGT